MMITKALFIAKHLQNPSIEYLRICCTFLQKSFNTTSVCYSEKPLLPIIDINADGMMYEDSEMVTAEVNKGLLNTSLTTIDGAPIAPIDIDPWVEEDEAKHGTVEDKYFDKKPIEYPPIPQERSGVYEFRGIKIVLPKKMLNDATYRYRLDPEDQETLADDMRICKFEK